MEKPDRIFISHSALDREFVEREIVSLLTAHDIKVWYSQQDIRTASQWQLSIQEGLEQCDWFLVVLSPQSVDSRWVRAEVHWALDERPDHVVPVLMADCNWQRLHLMLRAIQHVDLRGNLEDAKRRLLQTWDIRAAPEHGKTAANEGMPTATKGLPVLRPFHPAAAESTPATRPGVWIDSIKSNTGMQFQRIPAGEFMMGSPKRAVSARDNENPQHLVKITKPFYLSACQVTQQQYENVMGSRPWRGKDCVQEGPDCPAVYVSWNEAVEFCRKLSEQEGEEYRLPTEAQWEYACRAGTKTDFSFGDDVSKMRRYVWYDKNSWNVGEKYAHPVGQKLPNAWGLFDMHGNVWEWCSDWRGAYKHAEVADPSGPASGDGRVLRGGAFNDEASYCRSACRDAGVPGLQYCLYGFRVSRTYP